MADDFLSALGEFGVRFGMTLMGAAAEPSRQIDKTALANAILEASVQQASEIVSRLGVIWELDDQHGDFGAIVGIIARELISLTELLTDVKISLTTDCTRDVGDTCVRAIMALKQ